MSTADELRKIASAARPAVAQAMEAAEELAEFSDVCRTKGLEWSQIKALLKAEYQDAQDGGERVNKIREKADRASAYADMLAGGSPKNISGKPGKPVAASQKPAEIAPAAPLSLAVTGGQPVTVLPSGGIQLSATPISFEYPDLPADIDRKLEAQRGAA